jgi:hypothetical protein
VPTGTDPKRDRDGYIALQTTLRRELDAAISRTTSRAATITLTVDEMHVALDGLNELMEAISYRAAQPWEEYT